MLNKPICRKFNFLQKSYKINKIDIKKNNTALIRKIHFILNINIFTNNEINNQRIKKNFIDNKLINKRSCENMFKFDKKIKITFYCTF